MMMRKLIGVIAASVLLAACSAINTAAQSVNTDDANKAAYAAKATYASVLVVAAQYVKLTRCEAPAAPVLCSKQVVVDQIRKADLAADAATQAAENAVRTMGSDPAVITAAVTAATQAAAAFKIIAGVYGGK